MRRYKLRRGTEMCVNVAFMTCAGGLLNWFAGSVEADTCFCPERHGTYFGGFYLKDMPAMGKRDFDIGTELTGDSSAAFLRILTPEQRAHITGIVDRQRKALMEIVEVRRAISTGLRGFLRGEPPDEEAVLKPGRRYGELDGELSYRCATAFAAVHRTLGDEQKGALVRLRNLDSREEGTAFVHSQLIRMPDVGSAGFLFEAPRAERREDRP